MLLFSLYLVMLAILLAGKRELIPSTAEGLAWHSPDDESEKPSLCWNKGGGAPPPPKPQKMPTPPPPPAAPPPIPPPPTQTAIGADQAALDARKQELQRKGMNSTLLAGETGGANSQGKKSLLG